jgi:DNA-binding NarL/FixJ family response regulator
MMAREATAGHVRPPAPKVVPAGLKVVVGDDHRLFRAGLVKILSGYPNIQIVGEASSGSEAISQAISARPDVLLIELRLLKATALEAIRRLASSAPNVRIVVLSGDEEKDLLPEALDLGAIGVVDKEADPEDMVSQIVAVAAVKRSKHKRRTTGLSERECRVLREVARGLSNKLIAKRLGISDKTVKNHLSRIFAELGVANRTEAVMNAMRMGMLVL